MKNNNILILILVVIMVFFSVVACSPQVDSHAAEASDAPHAGTVSDGGSGSNVYDDEVCQAASEKSEYKTAGITDAGELSHEAYTGTPYDVINDNCPFFSEGEITDKSFEYYSELDELGRCGECCASVGTDIMPTEERGEIGQVKPTGWQSVKYDIVDGQYLYNRCHLLGFQLTGENANENNLITGTRYLNVEGMLPFENLVADYVRETDNHVMYRVTPVFDGDNLLAEGVLMEAMSVEDAGNGITFCVFCYNVQPGIYIDYSTGDSCEAENYDTYKVDSSEEKTENYILNTSTKKFHIPECSSVEDMKDSNREDYTGTRESLIEKGYSPCGKCNP